MSPIVTPASGRARPRSAGRAIEPPSRRAPTIKITHGPSPVPTKTCRRPGRAVDEVPGAERPLLLLDHEEARPREHEEVLLARLGVVHPARLAGLQHREREARLGEALRLDVRPLGEHPRRRSRARTGRRTRRSGSRRRLAGVDHEPARGRRAPARLPRPRAALPGPSLAPLARRPRAALRHGAPRLRHRRDAGPP